MREMKNFTRIGLFLLIAAASAVSASAVNLPGFKVPKGESRTSQSFSVPSGGQFTVNVKVRVAGLPLIGPGSSTYTAQLLRPDGSPADGGRQRTDGNFATISLSTNATCAQTGNWKVKVTNDSRENPQDGDVEFPAFNVPQPETVSDTLSAFTVNQGTSEDRGIPNSLEPAAPGGRMKVTAAWDGINLTDPAGFKATLTLLRNGQPYRPSDGGQSTGYSTNALFGNANPKASISINVPASDVSGDWSLRVRATSAGTISNVKPKVTFVKGCN